jgi:hypothetical protein
MKLMFYIQFYCLFNSGVLCTVTIFKYMFLQFKFFFHNWSRLILNFKYVVAACVYYTLLHSITIKFRWSDFGRITSERRHKILWRIARQRLRKHINAFAVTAGNSIGKVFSVWSAPRNNRGTVFSVRGPCREDTREYGNGNLLRLSSEVPREQQCGQKKNQKTWCVTLHVL